SPGYCRQETKWGSQFIYICNSSTPCTFEIVLAKSRRKVSNQIVVKSLRLTHDNSTGTAKACRKDMTSKPVVQNAVNANIHISGASLQYQVKANVGIDLNKRTAYRVIDDLVQLKYGNFDMEYKKVVSFLEDFATKNPTSFTAFEARDGKFHRSFLMNPHSGRIQPNCQQILGTDGAHTKHKLHEGKVLILIARDGDNKNVVLVVTMRPSEDHGNYNWFIECCKNGGIVFNNVLLFCDRGVALVSTATSHNDLTLIHCVKHIIGNMKKQYKKR
uniref:MULE transposase domain-containing protein n=1 Tax=Globisporangium ultimum (strain ATCC 200006 / CBS 805.95 / DAOM BR144) TaxID=431595 RepID=K3X6C0_GLOUD